MSHQPDVLVIGGGVIGVCCAHYLAEAGARVALLERGEIASGCSFGNAGFYVLGHSIPLAAPGALSAGLKWLLDPASPFYVKPRLSPGLWSWMGRFAVASREKPMRRGIAILRDLSLASGELYRELAALPDFSFGYAQRGRLTVYRTDGGLHEAAGEAALLHEFDLRAEVVDAARAHELEPALRPGTLGGVYFPDDAHIDPARFVLGLAGRLEERGVKIHTAAEVLGLSTDAARIISVRTAQGEFRPEQVVLAAGAWTPSLARDLGIRVPLQPAKGYSLTVPQPEGGPRIPLMLGETRVAVTPLGDRLRYAGTLELSGMDFSISPRRVGAIAAAATDYLAVEPPTSPEVWRGLRPCTPDGLPILGRTRRYGNLILATGHAMLGMSLGPVTGKLVAQVATGQPPQIDLASLRLERFGG